MPVQAWKIICLEDDTFESSDEYLVWDSDDASAASLLPAL